MTQLEKLKKRIPDETDDVLLGLILETAASVIINQRYPVGTIPTGYILETRYEWLQIEIAVEIYNKLGIEGQKSFSEDNVSRAFEAGFVSSSLLNKITQKGVVL